MTILMHATTTLECCYFDFLIRMEILWKVAGDIEIFYYFDCFKYG